MGWSVFSSPYVLNIWEFLHFVRGLSPRKLHVVRWRNFAHRCVPTMCRTYVGFYVYRGRCYQNNDIFLKLRACRPTLLLRCAAYTSWLQQRAGLLTECWTTAVSWQACHYLISPCVFNNVRRWPMQEALALHVLCLSHPVSLSFWFQSATISTWIFTRANQATNSSCSGRCCF